MSTKRSSRHWTDVFQWIIGLLAIGAIAAYFVQPPKADTHNAVELTLRQWLTNHYELIATSDVANVVHRIPFEAPPDVAPEMIADAKTSITYFIEAFSSGSLSNYLRFRFPQEATLIESNYISFKRAVENTNLRPYVLSPPPEWAIDADYLKTLTNKWPPLFKAQTKFPATNLHQTNFTELVVHYNSEGMFYKGYFEGIAPSNSYIRIEKFTIHPPPIASLMALERLPSGVFRGNRFYRFKRTPDEILTSNGTLMVLTSKIMIKLRAPDTVNPQYIRYYYDPYEHIFIPYEHAMGNGMSATYTIPWF